MRMGLVGFPAVGKSTLFNILTDARVETSTFGGSTRAETHTGMARVPDARLEELARLFSPKKTTPATIEYLDLAGLRKEDAAAEPALADLRNADALLHVVRAFENEAVPHSEGPIDPARDIATMETALLLADHTVATRRLEKLRASVLKTGRQEEKQEVEMLEQVLAALEAERPLRAVSFSKEQIRRLRGFAFLSARPILHLINLDEDQVSHLEDFAARFHLEAVARRPQTLLLPLSARIEQEIAELSPEDAAAFQADLGLADLCRPRVLRASYQLVGLISFFTVGADECRAWSIRRGTCAQKAAGVIHSDMDKGFIRAEVVPAADLLELRTLAAAREKGRLRLEGKSYTVQDGDVMNIRFNV